MNRELKFRAWHRITKEMLYPDHDRQSQVFAWLEEKQPIDLMQFTGLTDKNGKEIYEDDIMESIKFCRFRIIWNQEKTRFVAVTNNIFNGKNRYKCMGWAIKNCVVVGNIFENPELLK